MKTNETTLHIVDTPTDAVTHSQTVTDITSVTLTTQSQYTRHSTSKTEASGQPIVPTQPGIQPFKVDCTNPRTFCGMDSKLKYVPTIEQRTTIIAINNTLIQSLNSKSFSGLTQLKVLVLNYNKISSIEPDTFLDQVKLTELDLSYNVIKTLDGTMFQGLASLRVLRITGNNLTSIDPQTFSNLRHINTIQVDIIQLIEFRQIILSPSSYPEIPKVPNVTVENIHSIPCTISYCWLKDAEEKGYMKHYKYNGTVSRPKCSDRPDVFWDEVELDCPSSSQGNLDDLSFIWFFHNCSQPGMFSKNSGNEYAFVPQIMFLLLWLV